MEDPIVAPESRLANLTIIGAAAIVVVSVLLVVLIDLRNIFGLGNLLRRHFFWHWYANGGPVEMVQWGLLAGSSLASLFIAGKVHGDRPDAFAFWRLMGIAFVLMLIEDAGDPRHTIRGYVQFAFGEHDGQGVMGTLSELLYFMILGAVPLYALIRYGRLLRGSGRTTVYVLSGFVAYGLAVSLSFVGSAFSALLDRNFYEITGDALVRLGLFIGDSELFLYWPTDGDINFQLMDGMVEESIELLGAAAFFAASMTYLAALRSSRSKPTPLPIDAS